MVVQGHVAQLHFTTRIRRALDAHTLVRLGRIQLGTSRFAHHLAGHIANAQLIASNLHLRVDFVQFVLVRALLERFLRGAGVVFVVDVARPIVCGRENKKLMTVINWQTKHNVLIEELCLLCCWETENYHFRIFFLNRQTKFSHNFWREVETIPRCAKCAQ
jgi:hypothetical protein